jgi:hypothetical protein
MKEDYDVYRQGFAEELIEYNDLLEGEVHTLRAVVRSCDTYACTSLPIKQIIKNRDVKCSERAAWQHLQRLVDMNILAKQFVSVVGMPRNAGFPKRYTVIGMMTNDQYQEKMAASVNCDQDVYS